MMMGNTFFSKDGERPRVRFTVLNVLRKNLNYNSIMKSILLVTCTIISTMVLLKNKNHKFMANQNQHHITNEHLHDDLLKILNELAEIKKMIIEDRDNVSQQSLTRLKLIARHLTQMSK